MNWPQHKILWDNSGTDVVRENLLVPKVILPHNLIVQAGYTYLGILETLKSIIVVIQEWKNFCCGTANTSILLTINLLF